MGTPVPAYAAPPTVGEAGRAERNRAVFDRVWQLVADLHYDPKLGGVDWPAAAVNFGPQAVAAADDRALYRVLNAMLEPLGDSDITALTELLLSRALPAATVVVAHGAIGRCLIAEIAGLPRRDLVELVMRQGFYCKLADGTAEWFDATADAA